MHVDSQVLATSLPSGLTAKHGTFAEALKASISTPSVMSEVTLPSGRSSKDPTVTITNSKYSSKSISALNPVFREAFLSEVRKEQTKILNRKFNIVISGMIPLAGISDAELVQKLCSLHLDIRVDVVKTSRLAKLITGKVQLLLVTRAWRTSSKYYQARELRYSYDHQIRQSVFINPDLTPSEARAAF